MRILIIFLFAVFAFSGFSQISFYKLYSGTGYDKGEGVVQLADSSYTITGSSSSWSGNSDAFLLHLDSLGNYKWSRNYGGDEADIGRRVLFDASLGYFIAGYSNSFSGNGNFDAYLIRTDAIGNKLLEKTYGTENWEKINDAIITRDSAILMVGETQPVNGQFTEIYLVKTNFLGDTLWTKTFGTSGNDRANTVINLADSSFIIGGEMYIADSNLVKGFLMRMSRFGDILWQDTVGDLAGEYGVNDIFLGVNKFYTVGKRKVIETNHDDYFGSYDFNGNLVFQYTLNTPKNTMIDEVAFLPGINKTVIGTRLIDVQTYQDDYDNILAYCDTYYGYFDGTPGSYCVISNEGLDKCNQLLPTNDGGYVAIGFNSNTGDNITTNNGGTNIYFAKISPGLPHPNPFDATSGNVNFGQLVISQENELSNEMIYPNPFTDEIQIQVSSTDESKVVLVNQFGQVVFSSTFTEQTTLNTEKLPRGMYFIQINTKIYRLVK
jgi:hypothetical protein